MHFEFPLGDGRHLIVGAAPLLTLMFSLLCGMVCAVWARQTKRSGWLWFFFGLLLPPIAFIALVLKSLSAPPPPVSADSRRKDLASARKEYR